MGYTVLTPDTYVFDVPSWRPEEPARRIVEIPRFAKLDHSRAHLWRYPPGVAGRRHRQIVQEEVFFVAEGTFAMLLGDPPERHELPRGSIVVLEPGTLVKIFNEGDTDGLLFIYGAPADSRSEILED